MNNTNINQRIKWGKILPVIANVLSAFLFFIAYAIKPIIWFILASGVNIIVAVAIVILFNKFEKKYADIINQSDNSKAHDGNI